VYALPDTGLFIIYSREGNEPRSSLLDFCGWPMGQIFLSLLWGI